MSWKMIGGIVLYILIGIHAFTDEIGPTIVFYGWMGFIGMGVSILFFWNVAKAVYYMVSTKFGNEWR